MKIIMIFIDGLGIGQNSPSNPFFTANLPVWRSLLDNFAVYPSDACLGVPGLPQSATGQTSLYTGENAQKVLGRHYSSRPGETLTNLIFKRNIFTSLIEKGYLVTFANVYSKEYLERMRDNPKGFFKPSVTTLMNLSAKLPFRVLEDYENGLGVYHDITGEGLRKKGLDVPVYTPEEAADNLHRISREYDFTLFEFFVSDLAGHSMDMSEAVEILERMDCFIGSLMSKMDLNREVLIIVSDHGNIEDLSVSTHTMNPVPVFFITKMDVRQSLKIDKITDVFYTVLKLFNDW